MSTIVPASAYGSSYLTEQALQAARASLLRAQKDTQDAFMRYTSCLDIERQARQAVAGAEKRRDDISEFLIAKTGFVPKQISL